MNPFLLKIPEPDSIRVVFERSIFLSAKPLQAKSPTETLTLTLALEFYLNTESPTSIEDPDWNLETQIPIHCNLLKKERKKQTLWKMVLAQLGGSISRALQQMSNATIIDEKVLNECLNEISRALLQSDVQFKMVRDMQVNIKKIVNLDDLAAGHNKRKIIQQVRLSLILLRSLTSFSDI